MARYLFHLHHCGDLISDEEGRELDSLEAAVAQAQVDARGLMAAELSEGKLCLGCQIEVVEVETGRAIIVPFSTTIRLDSGVSEGGTAVNRPIS